MTFFSLDEFNDAAQIVRRHMAPTPQFVWPLLDSHVGAEVWVKHENCTPTGAFKVRGGLVYIDRMVRERPSVRGVVGATRGNHGQSLGFAVVGRVPQAFDHPRLGLVDALVMHRAL